MERLTCIVKVEMGQTAYNNKYKTLRVDFEAADGVIITDGKDPPRKIGSTSVRLNFSVSQNDYYP